MPHTNALGPSAGFWRRFLGLFVVDLILVMLPFLLLTTFLYPLTGGRVQINGGAVYKLCSRLTQPAGSFAPLRFVPKGKTIVLGLVTSKRGTLESKDELKRRIEEAARYVPLDQLALSPQCGFASTVEGNDLGIEEQYRKLQLVVETAAEVWH